MNKDRLAISALYTIRPEVICPTRDSITSVNRAELISKMPRKRALAAEDPRIGNISDFKLARSLGISESTVGYARRGLNIPRYVEYKQCSPETVLAQDDLGKVPDRVISERLGIAKCRVQLIRSGAGISSTVGTNIARPRPLGPPNKIDVLMQGWGR